MRRRGRLERGYFADVVVFDPGTIADQATFEQPHQYATGMEYVLVNGMQVLRVGSTRGRRPGAWFGERGAILAARRALSGKRFFSLQEGGGQCRSRQKLPWRSVRERQPRPQQVQAAAITRRYVDSSVSSSAARASSGVSSTPTSRSAGDGFGLFFVVVAHARRRLPLLPRARSAARLRGYRRARRRSRRGRRTERRPIAHRGRAMRLADDGVHHLVVGGGDKHRVLIAQIHQADQVLLELGLDAADLLAGQVG